MLASSRFFSFSSRRFRLDTSSWDLEEGGRGGEGRGGEGRGGEGRGVGEGRGGEGRGGEGGEGISMDEKIA